MLNWRKPFIYAAFAINGYPVRKKFAYLKSIEYESTEKILQLQNEKLETLLKHAYEYVPYYKRILSDCGIVKGDKIKLENFHEIPPLTKDIIEAQKEKLYSKDHKNRSSYVNTTGGSTGQPIAFLQDDYFQGWGFAHRLLCNHWTGKEPGQRELKLWGSERDVFEQAEKIATRLRRKGFNVLVLNSFLMNDEKMHQYIKIWNNYKPKLVEAYTSSILEFAKFLKKKGEKVITPSAIICSAETLAENVRSFIEEVFGCPAINKYGSRDAGLMACECLNKQGLHTFPLHNKIEILNDDLKPAETGIPGKIYITTLNNFSMPLIRYDIGDMAIPAENNQCSCGRGFPLIQKVIGRHIETFKTKDGRKIPGEFFIHFVGVVHNKNFVKKFQVIQKDFEHILIKIVVLDDKKFKEYKPQIVDSIQKVMGRETKVEFEYVDKIEPSKSGKYLYTISEVSDEL